MIDGELPENLPPEAKITSVSRLYADTPRDALEALLNLSVNREGGRLRDQPGCMYGSGPSELITLVIERAEVDLSTPLDEDYQLAVDGREVDQTTGSALGALLEAVAGESAVGGIWVEFGAGVGSSAPADWVTSSAFGETQLECDQARARYFARTSHPDFAQLAFCATQGEVHRGPVASFTDLAGSDEPVHLPSTLQPSDGSGVLECRIPVDESRYLEIQAHFGAVMGSLIEEGRVPCSNDALEIVGQDLSGVYPGDIAWLVRPTGVAMEFYWRDRGEDYHTPELGWDDFHAAIRDAAPVAGPVA